MWWHARRKQFSSFGRNGLVHFNRWGRQFSRLLAAEVCASAVVMLDTPCSEVVWRVLATHSIRQFPLHFPSRESPCAITFQLDSTDVLGGKMLCPWKVQAVCFSQLVPGLFRRRERGVKRPEPDGDHSPSNSVEVKHENMYVPPMFPKFYENSWSNIKQ